MHQIFHLPAERQVGVISPAHAGHHQVVTTDPCGLHDRKTDADCDLPDLIESIQASIAVQTAPPTR